MTFYIWQPQNLTQALISLNPIWHNGNTFTQSQKITTDTRKIEQGDIFLALKGENFDGHDYVATAFEKGAVLAITSHQVDDFAQIIVSDTRLALGQLGAYRRAECQNLKVVALTGSSGKTTTKEMLGSILAQSGETLITRGNLNNDLGVPMMLLELRQEHRYAVFELGANHIGEIDYTAGLVCPDVVGVLNIGTAHMGEFGGREGICKAKSEIYQHLSPQGIALYPAYDDFAMTLKQACVSYQHYAISKDTSGDIYAQNIKLLAQSSSFDAVTPQGTIHIQLPFAGEHNIVNALNAIGFALALGIDLKYIQTGLATAIGAKGRLNFIEKNNVLLIDDTYNANPTSMRVAADVLCQQQADIKIMVMGDIGELGEESIAEHQALGRDLVQKPLDYIVSVGEYAPYVLQGSNQHTKVIAFAHQQAAIDWLKSKIQSSSKYAILFKGSRYTHMENVLNALLESL